MLYGYPMTADNGYFLYYDKSVLTEEDVQTLDGILAAAEKRRQKGSTWTWPTAGIWPPSSWATAATLTLDADGKQICDFNNEKGLAAAEAIKALCDHPAFLAGGQDLLPGSIGDAICAGICGTWISSAVKEKLGDNYAACKLPTFTCGGEQVQMGSFLGCKILRREHPDRSSRGGHGAGRVPDQRAVSAARALRRSGYGPSNVNVAASEAVASEPALSAALAAQSAYAISQHGAGRLLDSCRRFRRGAGSAQRQRPAGHAGSAGGADRRHAELTNHSRPEGLFPSAAPDFLAERKFST